MGDALNVPHGPHRSPEASVDLYRLEQVNLPRPFNARRPNDTQGREEFAARSAIRNGTLFRVEDVFLMNWRSGLRHGLILFQPVSNHVKQFLAGFLV